METNAEHYGASALAYKHEPTCDRGGSGCEEWCRHCPSRRDRNRYAGCDPSWRDAPYGQPIDIRIPWGPELEKDPNPL